MSPRDRRALLAGGAVTLAALLVTRVIPPAVRSASAARESLRGRTELLMRQRAEVKGAGALSDSGAKVRTRVLALAPKVLPGKGAAEAVAGLANLITAAATTERVRIERTTPLGDSAAVGDLRRLSLRVSVTGDTRGTVGLLRVLGKGPVVLTTHDLRIVAPDPASASEALQSEFTVRGWYQERERGNP